MIERCGNIWEDSSINWLCVTTNNVVKKDGQAVMGAGIAYEAKERMPDLPLLLASCLRRYGNVPNYLTRYKNLDIYSFPTKYHFKENSSLLLIKESAIKIREHWLLRDNKNFINVGIPRPGCNNGGLTWEEVSPILREYLPEPQFIIYSR